MTKMMIKIREASNSFFLRFFCIATSFPGLARPFLTIRETISKQQSSLGTEMKAGLATFLTMSYIILINRSILAQTGAVLFLAALFFAPLTSSIPMYATAPALVYVACMMARAFSEMNWEDPTEYAPGAITAITMPLTFSIAEGISLGFITYTVVKVATGRYKELNRAMILLSLIFVVKYGWM